VRQRSDALSDLADLTSTRFNDARECLMARTSAESTVAERTGAERTGADPTGADRVVDTICTLDCPDACSLRVTVRAGLITAVDASPVSEFTDGWICSKVKRSARRVHASNRIMTPLIRTGPKGSGEFRPATWDEAIELVAHRMRQARSERGNGDSIVAFTYNSSAASIERQSLSEAFFAAIGATVADHTICAAINGVAWASVYGSMASADPRDVVNAQLVVIWGANPTVSNTHFPPLVNEAVKRGARVVVIDPRRTAMAKRADLHLAIRPGTDVVLALAIANHWNEHGLIDRAFLAGAADGAEDFLEAASNHTIESASEFCGLAAADVRTLADWWGTTKPSMLRLGWGLERNYNGGAGIRAVLALPVLGGHFRTPGSGVIGSVSTGAISPKKRWPSVERVERRHVALHQIGTWLAPDANDPCRVLFVQGANPAVMCPDHDAVVRALTRDDVFTVVHEQVMTDTARFGDVVLPATTSFEISDARSSYGSYFLNPVVPVIEPVGESKSNDEVGLALAAAFGFDWAFGSDSSNQGVAPAVADAGPRVVEVASRQFVDTAPATGRASLIDPEHGAPAYADPPAPDRRPGSLTLISPASSKLVNSIFGEFQSPSIAITIHPDDALARALSSGDEVVVSNGRSSIMVPLAVSAETRPGVAVMSKGVWLTNHHDGRGVNALTPGFGDPTVNGACFNDTFVTIERA
jgi:anaerobic selenocysteine-containing dehydrogenase